MQTTNSCATVPLSSWQGRLATWAAHAQFRLSGASSSSKANENFGKLSSNFCRARWRNSATRLQSLRTVEPLLRPAVNTRLQVTGDSEVGDQAWACKQHSFASGMCESLQGDEPGHGKTGPACRNRARSMSAFTSDRPHPSLESALQR